MKKFILFLLLLPLYLTGQTTDALKLRVIGNSYQDEMVVRFLNGATTGYDGNYDAFKFFSPNPSVPSIYTTTDNGWEMAVNSLPGLDKSWKIPVFIKSPVAGNYTIETEFPGLFESGTGIYLKNNLTGTFYDIDGISQFSVNFPQDTTASLPFFTLYINHLPELQSLDPLCHGDNNGILTATVFNDTISSVELTSLSASATSAANPMDSSFTNVNLEAGTYIHKLIFKNTGHTVIDTVLLTDPDPVQISVSTSTPVLHQDSGTVHFTALSSCNGSIEWSLGDGSTGQGESVTHFYASAGNYLVNATIRDSNNCSSEDMIEVTLQGSSVGVQNVPNEALKVYSSGNTIHIQGIQDQHIRIFSMNGSVVWEGRTYGSNQVNTEQWSNGVYHVYSDGKSLGSVYVN